MNNQDRELDLKQTMSTYGEMLFKICFIMVKNKYDTEDIIQETLLQYYVDKPKFDSEVHKKAWLIRVSQNKCKNLLKYKKRHSYVQLEKIEECLPNDKIYNNEDMEEFIELAKLDYKYKSVIVLHYIENFSVEETADMLEISQSAVKMRLKRGREKLKKTYEKYYVEEVL